MTGDLENSQRAQSRAHEFSRKRCSHLLVVDDERGPRESLRMILSSSHQVTTAEEARFIDVLEN